MLKRDITYRNFDDQEVTETFYFNLTKTEILNLELEHGRGGLEEFIKNITKTEDNHRLMKEFQRIVLMAYGVKSEDGKRFMKSDELRDDFAHSAAFDELIIEMLTSDTSAAEFMKGVLPSDVRAEADRLEQLPRPNIQPAENLRKTEVVELPQAAEPVQSAQGAPLMRPPVDTSVKPEGFGKEGF